ncbi:MAG TPA: CoA pyrophosphatase [Gammaproteobacteria bacterium]|nr:CoA pyrophosphatase [Gammaproteobacteria bacterium]
MTQVENANLEVISATQIARQLEHWHTLSMDLPEMVRFPPGPPKRAAVLVPLQRKDDGWHILFIRRAHRSGDHHSGQVAFPGGKVEQEDHSVESAALRETWEEIGLHPSNVDMVGRLQNLVTITNFVVTPFVGIVKAPFDAVLSETEVARVFTMPLHWLANPDNHILPGINAPAEVEVPKYGRVVKSEYFAPYDGEVLWGATARMAFHLIKLLQKPL